MGDVSATEIGNYGLAEWAGPPPVVAKTARAPSGVGAVVQEGHARIAAPQDVMVSPGDYDCLLFSSSLGRDVHCRIDGRNAPLSPGSCSIFFLAGQASRWICRPSTARVFHLHVPRSQHNAYLAEAYRPELMGPETAVSTNGERLAWIARDLANRLDRDEAMSALLLDSYANLILDAWCGARRLPSKHGLSARQLGRTIERLTDVGAGEASLATIAHEAGLSRFHFARAFKTSTGVSVHRYQSLSRVEQAKALLRDTRDSITEIAAAVGYDDPSYFTRVFRREVSLTPSAYRRERLG